MRISRLLAGSIVGVTFAQSPIPGLPPLPNPISDRQKLMDVERKRIAALPVDSNYHSRQTKRQLKRLMAKRERTRLVRLANATGIRNQSRDWRSYVSA